MIYLKVEDGIIVDTLNFSDTPNATDGWVEAPEGFGTHGGTYDGSTFVHTKVTLETLRSLRNAKLAESDWTQLSDVELSTSDAADWRTYRQSLRNFTMGYTELRDLELVWPLKPGEAPAEAPVDP
jgi:hypothetical protein